MINKNTKHIADINKILNQIPNNKKISFDKKLIEKLYLESFENNQQSTENFNFNVDGNKKILLIASGKSVSKYQRIIEEKIKSNEYV